MRLTLIAIASVLAGCAATQGTPPLSPQSASPQTAAFPPNPGVQAKGYDGPLRAQAEVATVFMSDGRPHYEAGFICKLNGRPVLAGGGCASVVYLLPGTHALGIRYKSTLEVGEGELPLRVEAGKVYQLNATSFRTNNRGMISVLPMPQGTRVTYRNVAPNLFPAATLDQPIPYPAQ